MQGSGLIEIDQVFALLVGNTVAVVGTVEPGVERAEASGVLAELVLPELVIGLVLRDPVSDREIISKDPQSARIPMTNLFIHAKRSYFPKYSKIGVEISPPCYDTGTGSALTQPGQR